MSDKPRQTLYTQKRKGDENSFALFCFSDRIFAAMAVAPSAASSPLSRRFTLAEHLRFAFPRMVMSLFSMTYMAADGVLISRYMGTVAPASLNMIFPLAILLSAVGIMLSAGGGSVVSRRLGSGDTAGANRAFSTLVYAEALFGPLVGGAGAAALAGAPRLAAGHARAVCLRDYHRVVRLYGL